MLELKENLADLVSMVTDETELMGDLEALEVSNNLFTPRIANVLPRGGRNPYVWHMAAETTQHALSPLVFVIFPSSPCRDV